MVKDKKGVARPVGFSKKALQKKEKRNLKRKARGKGSRNV
jgi:hypothetical protein